MVIPFTIFAVEVQTFYIPTTLYLLVGDEIGSSINYLIGPYLGGPNCERPIVWAALIWALNDLKMPKIRARGGPCWMGQFVYVDVLA